MIKKHAKKARDCNKKGLAVAKLTSLLLTITKKKLQQASRNKVFSFDNYRYLNYTMNCWYRVPLLRGHLLKMDKANFQILRRRRI